MPLDQLPDVSQLSQMQFLPAAQYQAAQQNLATQQQSAQLALQQQQNEIQQGSLANLHAQAMNPSTEQEESQKASMGQMSLENAQALQPLTKAEQRQAALTKMSTDQLAQFSAQAQVQSADPDPTTAAMGKTKMAALESFQLQKAKDDAAQQRMDSMVGGRTAVAGINAQAKLGVANLTTQSQQYIAGMKDKTEQSKVQAMLGKMRPEQAETMMTLQAQAEEDPALRAAYNEQALHFHNIAMSERAAGAQFGINMPDASGMQANQMPSSPPTNVVIPRPAARPAMAAPGGPTVQYPGGPNDMPPPLPPGATAQVNAAIQAAQQRQAPPGAPQAAPNGAPPPQAAPSAAVPPQRAAVPPGNVEIFKNGKSAGMVPAAKLQQALKQGYTTQ